MLIQRHQAEQSWSEMKIENSFTVARSPAETWKILLDVPFIAGCVPGAELLSSEGDFRHKGKIAVRLGPVSLSFKGTAELSDMDKESMTAVLKASGMDEKGRGSAGSTSQINIEPHSGGSRVNISTDLQLSGSVAQYGRASGIITAVANEIVAAFSTNLRNALDGPADAGEAIAQGERIAKAPAPANTLGARLLIRAFGAWLKGLFGRSA